MLRLLQRSIDSLHHHIYFIPTSFNICISMSFSSRSTGVTTYGLAHPRLPALMLASFHVPSPIDGFGAQWPMLPIHLGLVVQFCTRHQRHDHARSLKLHESSLGLTSVLWHLTKTSIDAKTGTIFEWCCARNSALVLVRPPSHLEVQVPKDLLQVAQVGK